MIGIVLRAVSDDRYLKVFHRNNSDGAIGQFIWPTNLDLSHLPSSAPIGRNVKHHAFRDSAGKDYALEPTQTGPLVF
jgi:hypothetical protein